MNLPVNYASLSPQERRATREEYIRRQKGLCAYCGVSLSEQPANDIMLKWVDKDLFPVTFFDYPIHLHHSHETGLTIGAIHARCNAVAWQYDGE